MTKTWEDVLTVIEGKVPPPTFNRWFRPLTAETFTDGEVCLVADDEFDALFIEKNFAALITLHLRRITGDGVNLRITHGSRLGPPKVSRRVTGDPEPPGEGASSDPQTMPAATSTPSSAPPSSTPTERVIDAGLRLQYAFEDFVVGVSNEFAHAACRAVQARPGAVYNPLFICGGVGLGKTHLLNAIGIEMLRSNPETRVRYCSSESFMNELIEHIKSGRMPEFRDRYRVGLDALLIDDVQFLAGKEATQQEFFHTFNALHQTGAQIVLTSDRYPQEIPDIEERLRSRFQWGLVADIQPPCVETRLAILRNKADQLNLPLSDDVASFLAENVRSNVRELEGALLRLHAFVGFNRGLLTVDLARNLLRQIFNNNNHATSVETVKKIVASYFNVRVADLKGKGRQRAISVPRQIAMFLAKKHTGLSYPLLGKAFGGRDHTTVLAACRKVGNQIESDAAFRDTVAALDTQITKR